MANLPGHSITQFADAVLAGLGAPITQGNRAVIYAWANAEGGTAENNPLNTTLPAPGTTDYNSIGVKNYGSFDQGVTATVNTLKGSAYSGIVSDLRKGNVDPYTIVTRNAGGFTTWVSGRSSPINQQYINNIASGVGGPPPKSVSILDVGANLKTGYGDIAHTVAKPFESAYKDVLFAAAIGGGILIMLTGIVLIGADLGIAVLGRKRTTVVVNNVAGRTIYRKRTQDEKRYLNRNYRTSRESSSAAPKVRAVAVGPNATKRDEKMVAKTKEEIPF